MSSTELTKAQEPGVTSYLTILTNSKASVKDRTNALSKMVDGYQNDLSSLLPKHVDFDRMKQMFILNVKQTPKLLECEPGSLIKALFTAAAMGLEPDPYFGQVYLLPYGKNVQVIPGYKGLIQLVRNSGEISSITAEVVKENDVFDYDLASGERPKHRPNLTGDRGKSIAFYCIANFREGGFHFEFMTRADVDAIRNRSAASKSGKGTPWDTDYDEMGKKTVVRRAVKRLPISLTKQTRAALIADDAAFHGRPVEVNTETGEIIDFWADSAPSEEVEKPEAPAKTSRLDSFAGQAQQGTILDAEAGK